MCRRRKELREAKKSAARAALLKEVDPAATADEQVGLLPSPVTTNHQVRS